MRRLLASSLAVIALAVPRFASAQCVGSRPDDPEGYANQKYGDAEVRTYVTKNIRVHYAADGPHAADVTTTRPDSVPDTVAYAGDVGQAAMEKFVEMGFRPIPGDGSCEVSGGDDRIDIYLVKFSGADGSTAPEACNGNVCSSFILVDSTFKGRGYPSVQEGFRTVVVHELFHAVQNAYDKDIERFWAEGTAQWAMKTLHPELIDFERQLPAFFAEPQRSLDSPPSGVTAGFLYGSAVWPLFLSIKHGPSVVREILEAEAGGMKTVDATESVLVKKETSLAREFPTFAAWNVATKTLEGTGGYPDAAKYPGVKTAPLEDGASGITSGLSSFAFVGTLEKPLLVSLETDQTRNGGVVVPIEGGKPRLDRMLPLPSPASGEVLVVVAGTTSKKTDAPFTLRIGEIDPGFSKAPEEQAKDDGCNVGRRGPSDPATALVALGVVAFLRSRRRTRR